ncbi:MAG: potassium channel family protein [Solirubrobacterales bacterium]
MYYWIITLKRALGEPEARGALRSAGLLLLSGVIFYCLIEKWTFVDSLYFCVTTLTTVGFGNPAPSTDLGKLFTVFFVLSGVGMFLAVVNAVGKAAVKTQLESPRFSKRPTSKAERRQAGAASGSDESGSVPLDEES